MIGTEFIEGFGLGNQLLCLITAKCIAIENGCEFGTANQKQFANNMHSNKGMYFMDIDLGGDITEEMKAGYNKLVEADDRFYIGTSKHDMRLGCYISGTDDNLKKVADNTLIYGNMQSEDYFGKYREEIKKWFHVKPEYDSYEYSRDNLCIINMRGGEYTDEPSLYLDRSYFLKAMKNMRKIRPDMEFMVVTEDEEAARKVLPEIESHHFDMGRDYVTVKNAKYLILSNSSFAILPAMTSDTVEYIIAPKYWARHNVSDGFWSSEQNIYSFFNYMDRKGRMFTADECRREYEEYKKTSRLYARKNVKPGKVRYVCQIIRRKCIYGVFYSKKIIRSLGRRLGIIKKFQY